MAIKIYVFHICVLVWHCVPSFYCHCMNWTEVHDEFFSDRSVQQETPLSSISRSSPHISEEGQTPARGRSSSVGVAGTRRCPGSRDARRRRDACSGARCPSQSIHKHPAIRGRRWVSQKVTWPVFLLADWLIFWLAPKMDADSCY
jgi:hypothetical protein